MSNCKSMLQNHFFLRLAVFDYLRSNKNEAPYISIPHSNLRSAFTQYLFDLPNSVREAGQYFYFTLWTTGSPGMVLGPAALVSPLGNLLEMQSQAPPETYRIRT